MTNPKVITRLATTEDAQIIALLGRVTFAETFGHFFRDRQDLLNYFDATFSVDKIERSIRNPNNVYWVSFVHRLPVGFAKLKLNSHPNAFGLQASEKVCQLQKIYVLKDFISQKIGAALQNQLLEKARLEGFGKIWLSVLESNERAKSFYLKHGFEPIGVHGYQIGKEKFNFIAMSKVLH